MKKIFTSLLILFTGLFFVGAAKATDYPVNDTASFNSAATTAVASDTISFTGDFSVGHRIDFSNPGVTINGNGHIINANFVKTNASNNAAIGIFADNFTISNLIVDGTGGTSLHCVNIYIAQNVLLDNVTLQNCQNAGLVVNGSTVTVNNITTKNNLWGGINVDLGSGVTDPATLTVNGLSHHNEAAHIWEDDFTKQVSVIDTNMQYYSTDFGNKRVFKLKPIVHIFKYINDAQATVDNAGGVSFPMFTSTYNAPFTLSPSGWTTGDEPYEASTSPMNLGSSYSAEEKLDTSLVGESCDGSHQYALVGYGTGDTKEAALATTPITEIPSFTNLQGDKYIIVRNHKCPELAQVKVHILKYLDGQKATSVPGGYQFPMSATWSASNIGAGTGDYVLGSNWGGAPDLYGADTTSMTAPADYSTNEVTGGTSKVLAIGAKCTPGMYRLKGYKTSSVGFVEAQSSPLQLLTPTFTGLTADQYVIVMNETCPTGPTSKDQCKKDGWKTFNNPTFKNQGECVSYVERHEKEDREEREHKHHDEIERFRREALERLRHIMEELKHKRK